MHEMYVVRKMPAADIGKELGLSTRTVLAGLRFCGISARSLSAALRGIGKPYMRGSRNPSWKGGLTTWRKLAREGLNAAFVRPVMERDGFACQWCGSKRKIVVHHSRRSFMEIVHVVQGRNSGKPLTDLVREIIEEHRLEDGITLCKVCHDDYHKVNGKCG
jgi:hypothetical protein